MRFPLRFQILLPLLAILALALAGVSAAHAWLTTRSLQAALDERMRAAARTLAEGTFPLEGNVLRQASQLSGAQLAVTDLEHRTLAASSSFARPREGPQEALPNLFTIDELRMDRGQALLREEKYLYAVTRLDRRASGGELRYLHLYYPERTFREARRQAVYPSLIVGGVALALTLGLAGVVAARVTQPVQALKRQTERIAAGDFAASEPPARDDELRDLSLAVNRMAAMLAAGAEELRQHERAATLHQIGAGIAHQLRNAATGCRMALDLFRRREAQWRDDENLAVAVRQLELMESYLQRFLTLGKAAHPARETLDVAHLLDGALALVRPLAEHLHVQLVRAPNETPPALEGDRAALEQLFVNLLTNAIEACAALPNSPEVRILWEEHAVIIADNGPGPAAAIGPRLGQPFVTDKPGGTGLGLAVAKEILSQHGGELSWERASGWTRFIVRWKT